MCDPGSELRKRGSWRSRAKIISGMGKTKQKNNTRDNAPPLQRISKRIFSTTGRVRTSAERYVYGKNLDEMPPKPPFSLCVPAPPCFGKKSSRKLSFVRGCTTLGVNIRTVWY
ncbi:unnamed protein product [Laminaria digitata]